MTKIKPGSAGLIEDAKRALEEGKVLTPTRKERNQMAAEMQKKQNRVLLGSAIISTLMMYNLDDMDEMNLMKMKFKYEAKKYHKNLETHLNTIFDAVNMPDAEQEEIDQAVDDSAKFIDEAVRVITRFLDEYIDE